MQVSCQVKSFCKSWKGNYFILQFSFPYKCLCPRLFHFFLRDLREPYVDNISINDLVHLEEQLQAALITARSTKVNFLKQFNFLFRIHYLQKEQPQAVLFRTRSKDVEFFYFLSTRSEKDEEIFSTVIVTSSENTNFEQLFSYFQPSIFFLKIFSENANIFFR